MTMLSESMGGCVGLWGCECIVVSTWMYVYVYARVNGYVCALVVCV